MLEVESGPQVPTFRNSTYLDPQMGLTRNLRAHQQKLGNVIFYKTPKVPIPLKLVVCYQICSFICHNSFLVIVIHLIREKAPEGSSLFRNEELNT